MKTASVMAAVVAAATVAAAQTQPSQQRPEASRGELLYTTQCIACHNTQVHWRDRRLVTDWESLKAQVRRWQAQTGQQWSDADIVLVARYLNDTIYHFPQTTDRVSLRARTLSPA